MGKTKLAKILSIVLGPYFWMPVIFLTMVLVPGISPNQTKIILPVVLILQVIIPIAFVSFAPRLGWIKEWDTSDQRERGIIISLLLGVNLLAMIIIYFFGNNLLFNLNLILTATTAVFFVINKSWKISLHASLNTTGSILINFLLDWKLPILFLVIPLVCWSRYILKKHSMLQLIGGVLVTAVLILGGLKLFSLI